jgi:hypothetical protein
VSAGVRPTIMGDAVLNDWCVVIAVEVVAGVAGKQIILIPRRVQHFRTVRFYAGLATAKRSVFLVTSPNSCESRFALHKQGRPETDTFPKFGQFEGSCLSHRQPERRENS